MTAESAMQRLRFWPVPERRQCTYVGDRIGLGLEDGALVVCGTAGAQYLGPCADDCLKKTRQREEKTGIVWSLPELGFYVVVGDPLDDGGVTHVDLHTGQTFGRFRFLRVRDTIRFWNDCVAIFSLLPQRPRLLRSIREGRMSARDLIKAIERDVERYGAV